MNTIPSGTIRGLFVGENFRNGLYVSLIATATTLCLVLFDLLLDYHKDFRGWDWPILVFIISLIVVTLVHSYNNGGIIDCWLAISLPIFIANITFMSVAPSIPANHIPIWRWPVEYPLLNLLKMAFIGSVLWSLVFGSTGFFLGKIFNIIVGRSRYLL